MKHETSDLRTDSIYFPHVTTCSSDFRVDYGSSYAYANAVTHSCWYVIYTVFTTTFSTIF